MYDELTLDLDMKRYCPTCGILCRYKSTLIQVSREILLYTYDLMSKKILQFKCPECETTVVPELPDSWEALEGIYKEK